MVMTERVAGGREAGSRGVTAGSHGAPSARRRRTGRRPQSEDARADILEAALPMFAEHGFEKVSVRAVAREAGVDPALIRHYFTNKSGLLLAAVTESGSFREVVAAASPEEPRAAGQGERLARAYLRLWEDPQTAPVVTALARALLSSADASGAVSEAFVAVTERLLGADAALVRRLSLVLPQLAGVALARSLLGVPALAGASVEDIAARLGPSLDLILDSERRDVTPPIS